MRLLLLSVFAISCYGQMLQGIVGNVQHTSGGAAFVAKAHGESITGTTDPAVSNAINTTGSNLIVVVVGNYAFDSATATITDAHDGCASPCNTWSHTVSYDNQTNIAMFWAKGSGIGGTNHVITVTGNYPAIWVYAFSGANTSSQNDTNAGGSISVVSSGQPGSITPAANGEILVTAFCALGGSSPSVDSGYSSADFSAYNPSISVSLGAAYQVQGTAGAINPTWSFGTNTVGTIMQAAFKVP